MMKYNSIFVTL